MITAIRLFMSAVWSFLLPSLKIYLTDLGVELSKTAIDAVKYAAAITGTGTEKRKAAVEYVINDLKARGFGTVAKNKVYLAVVAAYEKIYGDDKE